MVFRNILVLIGFTFELQNNLISIKNALNHEKLLCKQHCPVKRRS